VCGCGGSSDQQGSAHKNRSSQRKVNSKKGNNRRLKARTQKQANKRNQIKSNKKKNDSLDPHGTPTLAQVRAHTDTKWLGRSFNLNRESEKERVRENCLGFGFGFFCFFSSTGRFRSLALYFITLLVSAFVVVVV